MPLQLDADAFRDILDNFPYGTVLTDIADGTLIYANKASIDTVRRITGVHDIIGRSTLDLGFWQSDEARIESIEASRQPGGHVRRFDEGTATEMLNSRVVTIAGHELLMTVVVDITPALDVERQLEDALQQLKSAQAQARIGDLTVTLDTDSLTCSGQAMTILGLGQTGGSITLAQLFETFHPDDLPMIMAELTRGVESGAFDIEHRLALRTDESEPRWVHTIARADESNGQHFHGTVQDISARKHEEAERRRLQQKMQEAQKLESLGLLAGGIAHDFNNLLTGIMGNADFALLGDNVPPEVADRLKDIIDASRRAADLTKQLLAYSGKGRFVISRIDVSELVREMSSLLRTTIDKDHVVHLHLGDALPAVEADGTQLRQIVMNLIINASEAIEGSQGVINITTGIQACSPEYLENSEMSADLTPGTYVYLEVSDNGIGMDPETIARLYDPFFTTKFTGRGLGMAAAHGIVRGHGGAIKVYSEPGRGTTFKVFLPTVDAPAEARRPVPPVQVLPIDGVILVVDDDEVVRNSINGILRSLGYEVMQATNGREGEALFREHHEDVALVILDLTMPEQDGRKTFAAMREIDPDVVTVLMSGYNEQEATQDFVGRGLAGFLPKPFIVGDLLRAIRAALRKQPRKGD